MAARVKFASCYLYLILCALLFYAIARNLKVKSNCSINKVSTCYQSVNGSNDAEDSNGFVAAITAKMNGPDDPPVYSRGSQPPSRPPQPRFGQQPPYYGNVTQQQHTPYPVSQASGMPMPNATARGYGPSSLPYPTSGARQPSYPSHNSALPPYPASGSIPTTGYQPPTSYPSANQTPYPASSSGYPPYSSGNLMPIPRTQEQQTQSFQQRSGPERQPSVLDPNVLKASLLSSVEDKLKRRVKEVFEQAKRELDDLQSTHDELKARSQSLERIMDNLKQEETMAMKNVELLERKNTELTEVISKLEDNAANMKIDEAVVTTAPLYNQILTTFAEENAVEDAIYYLSEALRREVIDLETFLKTVRSLSRKQFILRAQLKKARQVAGLKEMSSH